MKKIIPIVFIFLTLSCGENVFKSAYQFDENIDKSVKKEIHRLNDKITGYLKNDNFEALYEMFTDGVKKKQSLEQFKQAFDVIKELLKKYKLKIFKEYYSCDQVGTKNVHYLWDLKNEDDTYRVESESSRIYLSVYETDIKNDENSYLLTIQYATIGKEWNLEKLHVGQYKIHGLNYTALVKEGNILQKKRKYIPSIFRYQGAEKIAKAVPFTIYKMEDKRLAAINEALDNFNKKYKFPITIKTIQTEPRILEIRPEFVKGGALPVVQYISRIPLNQAYKDILDNEVNMVAKILMKKFPAIGSEFKMILFSVFDGFPGGVRKVNQYKTRVKVN